MKRLSDQTLYEIIEVSVDASTEEIRRACDRAAATYGPGSLATYTLAAPEETALLSSRIEEARAVLLDPSARSRYDERIGVRPPSPVAEVAPAPGPVPDRAEEPAPVPGLAETRFVSPGLPASMFPPAAPPPPAAVAPASPLAGAGAGPAVAPPPDAPPSAATPIPLTVQVASTAPARGPAAGPGGPILLDREVAGPRPVAGPEASVWTGEMLRRVRESRGLTVQQLAERTRVTRHHLENIEQDRFTALPAPVYLRGIIMSLSRELRLDGQKVARSYLDRVAPPPQGEPRR